MHRLILQIALPSIISNITVPLLALADTAIAGHLGAASYIGAIAIGGMIFNMIYWLFGFLRMGTGGLTAQAYGAGNQTEALRILLRSLSVAAVVSSLLIVLQQPLADLAFSMISTTPEVEKQARIYYTLLIGGAPAVLGLYSMTGWFLGMQNARIPMYIAIVQNLVNIGISLSLVAGLGWKVEGVATGTLVAQYAGFIIAAALWYRHYRSLATADSRQNIFNRQAFGRFFNVNRDIFLRTLCLIAVSTYFTSAGAAQGELTLAGNTLLMQFFIIFSYIMDGFAYAGEALGGRCLGASQRSAFKLLTYRLFQWGGLLMLLFTITYLIGGEGLLRLLTNSDAVRHAATSYLPYAIAIPAVSFAAFLYDGLFIGTTSTRYMLWTMACSCCIFFLLIGTLPSGNTSLWLAFLAYLGSRSTIQALLYPKVKARFGRYSK